jgi:subtilisin-like proprotein convertase family protein
MNAFTVPAFLVLLGLSAPAAVFVFDGINHEIPDGDDSGWVDVQSIQSTSAPIDTVRVTLDIAGTGAGGFNGDLYATLQHGTGFAVLLNRPGLRGDNLAGYSDSGLTVTFDDLASNGDVHRYRFTLAGDHDLPLPGALTGTWAPDGRTTDPERVMETDPRSALLDSFAGQDPNGDWVLFVADLSSGGTSRINGWSLEVDQAPIPEPRLAIGMAAGGCLAWVLVRLWSRLRHRSDNGSS